MLLNLSKRIIATDATALRNAFAMAAKLKNPCNLSIGQPHFPVPEAIKEAAITAIQNDQTGYTAPQGIQPLREALLQDYKAKGAPQEDVFTCVGVSGGIVLAFATLCDVGDEILLPDPYYLMYKQVANTLEIKPVFIDAYPTFRWERAKLEQAITPKTKIIVVNSPSNPTGVTLTVEEAKIISEVAKKYDLWILQDEIYEHFNYDQPHLNLSNYYAKTITLKGFSKSYSMTGWRLGSVAGPRAILDEMLKLQMNAFICAPTHAQWAAITALKTDISDRIADYKKKRDKLAAALKPHYEFIKPNGAFYFFIKAPHNLTGQQFVQKALEKELIVIAGSVFSERDTHFRLSFATSEAELDRGIEILIKLAKG